MKPSVLLFLFFIGYHTISAQPANDDFANAIDIDPLLGTCSPDAAYTTVNATADMSAGSCWNTSPDYNVWFSFTGTSTGNMSFIIETGGSKGNIRRINAAIWDATGITQLACQRYIGNDDNITIEVVGGLVNGNQYYLSVDNNYSGYQGTFSICMDDSNVSYDYYEGAIDIDGLIGTCSSDAAYTTYGATGDKNPGSCWNTTPDYNRWFTFHGTSTGNMKITIDRGGSKGDIRRINAAVWEADGTTQVACTRYIGNDDDIVLEIVGGLTNGTQYYLSVDNNYSGYRGSFTLCLDDSDAAITYDYYEGAIDINGLIGTCSSDAAYTTYGATGDKNPGSCWDTSPDYNRWFTFDGTSTGNMKITIDRGGSKGDIRRINAAVWEADGTTLVACKRYIGNDDDIVLEIVGGLTNGTQYYLSVDNNYSGYRGSFTLCLDDSDAAITYDYYEGAIDINGLIGTCSSDAAYTTYGATGDKNPGSCWDTTPDYNRWFTFDGTSTGNMKITIDRGGSKGDIRRINAAVWEADGTTLVACKRYIGNDDDIVLEIVGGLTNGTQYYLSVDNNYSGYRGSFTLCLDDSDAAITYDYYEGAIDINGLIGTCSSDAAYTTYGATGDKNPGSCWDTSPDYNRWFTFDGTSTGNMKITIDRGGSKGDIRRINAAVWEADGTTLVACKRYIGNDDDIVLEIVGGLTNGTQYYLSVDNNYSGYRGSFTLCLDDSDAAITYDYYEGALELADIHNWCSADAAYTTYGATGDKNPGSCWNTSPDYNRWFKFVATTTFIDVDVKTFGSEGTARRLNVALWESDGTTLVSCNRYIGNDDDVSVGSTTLTPGNTYYISVDNNYSGYRGTFTLCVNDDPDYDYYEGAIELADLNNWCSTNAAYTTSGATSDLNAGSCWNTSPDYNRWFKFTAVSPNVTIEAKTFGVEGTVRRLQLALWQSDGTTQIACQKYVGNDDDISISNGSLVPGNDYYVSVDNNYSGYRGTFTLCVNNIDGTYYTRQSGSWTDPNTWSTVGFGGSAASDYPQAGDVANIEGYSVTITGNETIAELNMNAATNNTGLTISNGSIDIAGNFEVTNPGNNFNLSFTFANSTIHVNNDFTINRNGGTSILSIIASGTTLNVDNDFGIYSTAGTGDNTLTFSTGSNVTIGNDLVLSNTGGPKTTLSISNSDATVTNDLSFTASSDNLVELDLQSAANLYLNGDVLQGSPAYGILSSSGSSTVHYNSSDNLQTVASTDGSGTGDVISYENLTINNSRITTPQVSLGGNVVVTGTLTLTDGELKSTSGNLLTLAAGASTTGASINSFVDGPIKKIGNTPFEFPVGDNNFWQPISIANLTGDAATEFTAEYFEVEPTNNTTLKSPDPNGDLNNISGLEYWNLSNTGTSSNADITLYWKDQTRSDIDDAADLQIAHYTGSEWENLGQDAISFTDPGSITVQNVSSFSPFAFGSMSNMVNALPVELVSFTGTLRISSVLLNWQTASELNNDYFEVQKSIDGNSFQAIGRVKGTGTSSLGETYSFADYEPIEGIQYYRLKQVDFNGSSQYSTIILVRSSGLDSNQLPSVFPNPGAGSYVTLITDPDEELIEIRIIDGLGKVLLPAVSKINQNQFYIDISDLDKGLYLFQIQTDIGIKGRRFIRQ